MNQRNKSIRYGGLFMLNLAAITFAGCLGSPRTANPSARPFILTHPNSYDIFPTILFDETDGVWKMWWCGFNGLDNPDHLGGDAIWYATSADGENWSGVQKVVNPSGNSSDWDANLICAVSVIKNPNLSGSNWKYAMYYEGAGPFRPTATHNPWKYANIGLMMSNDGISWTKYRGNPLLSCDSSSTGDQYGCGLPNVIKLPDGTFVMAYTIDTGSGLQKKR